MRPPFKLRGVRLAALLAVLLAATAAAQHKPLPSGFGGIDIETPWDAVSGNYRYESLGSRATAWEAFLDECGYRASRLEAQNGELLVAVNDFLVTELSFATPLEPGTDLREVASVVQRNYGEPERIHMRTRFGLETGDPSSAHFITLYYSNPRPVEFSISGDPLWSYQITARSDKARWHANRTLLCARKKEKAEDRRRRSSGTATP